MNQADIKNWIRYWNAAKLVNFSNIKNLADMETARKFCPCMQDGAFTEISTNTIWYALQELQSRGWVIPGVDYEQFPAKGVSP